VQTSVLIVLVEVGKPVKLGNCQLLTGLYGRLIELGWNNKLRRDSYFVVHFQMSDIIGSFKFKKGFIILYAVTVKIVY